MVEALVVWGIVLAGTNPPPVAWIERHLGHPKARQWLSELSQKGDRRARRLLMSWFPEEVVHEPGLHKLPCSVRVAMAGVLVRKGFVEEAASVVGGCNAPGVRAAWLVSRGRRLEALLWHGTPARARTRLVYQLLPSYVVAVLHLHGLVGSKSPTLRAAVKTLLLAQAYESAAVLASGLEGPWARFVQGYALLRAGHTREAARMLESVPCASRACEVVRSYWLARARGTRFVRTSPGPLGWWYSLVDDASGGHTACTSRRAVPVAWRRRVSRLWRCPFLDSEPARCRRFVPKRTIRLPSPFSGCPPVPWHDAFVRAAQEHGVPLGLLYAVAWAESGFDPAAISRAGAFGPFQLTPSVAHREARRLGIAHFTMAMAADPSVGAAISAAHLASLHARLGSWLAAVAAYNAGAADAERWFSRGLDAAEAVEEISFDETRRYVKYVMAAWWMYATAHGWDHETATIRAAIGLK